MLRPSQISVKEAIDIEALLDWAYRRECVHKGGGVVTEASDVMRSSVGAWGAIESMALLGTRIDVFMSAPSVADTPRANDAELVHDAVLRLDDIWIEWRADDDPVFWRNGERHDVDGLEQVGVSVLVIQHAKSGTVPDWHEGHQFQRGPKPEHPARKRSRNRVRLPIDGWSDHEVFHARAIYVAWRMALQQLVSDLEGKLRCHEVTGVASREIPWMESPRRVLKTL